MNDWLLSAAAWWLGTALGGGLILLVAWAAMRGVARPAARQRLGELAVIAALGVAVLRLFPAWLSLPVAAEIVPESTFEAGEWVTVPVELAPNDEMVWLAETPEPPTAEAVAASWDWRPIVAALTATYLAVVALFVGRWLLGQWALGRLLRQSRPASPRARRLFTAMAAPAVWPLPRLGLSRRLLAPAAFGLRRPSVLLPEAFEAAADDAKLRWVFAHELEHLRRRDQWSNWALGLGQAVFFFVPWFWAIKRQVRLCQEYVADAAAARQGAAADEYAEFLVSLVKLPAAPLGAAGLGSSSDLLRRVQMLLQAKAGVDGNVSRSWSAAAACGLFATALVAGGLGVRADEPAEKPEAKQIKIVEVTPVVTGRDLELVVNLDDADTPDAKKKTEKKQVIVLQGTDGKQIVTVPADADWDDVKKLIEQARAKAKGQADSAKQREAEAKDRAKKMQAEAQIRARKVHAEVLARVKEAQADADGVAKKAVGEAKKAAEEGKKAAQEGKKAAEEGQKAAEGAKRAFRVVTPAQGAGGGGTFVFAQGGQGRLGVQVAVPGAVLADQLDLPKGTGLVITQVNKDSAAAKAGLKANDVLLEMDGQAVPSDADKFAKVIREMKTDEEVDATVLRKGRKERVKGIKLTAAKAAGQPAIWQALPKQFEGKFPANVEFKFEGVPALAEIKKLEDLKNLDPKKIEELKKKIQASVELKLDDLKGMDPKKLEELKKKIHAHVHVVPHGKGEAKGGKTSTSSQTMSVEVNDGTLKATIKDGDVTITVTGEVNNRKVTPSEIMVQDGDEKTTYSDIKKVPAQYRSQVQKLLDNTGAVQFQFKKAEKKDE